MGFRVMGCTRFPSSTLLHIHASVSDSHAPALKVETPDGDVYMSFSVIARPTSVFESLGGYAGGVTDTGALVLGFKVSPVHSGSDVNLTSYYIESPGLEPTLCGCATSQLDSSWPDELMPVLEAGVSADELLHAVNTIQRHSPVNHEAVTMAFGVGFNPGCAPDDGGGLPPSSVAALRQLATCQGWPQLLPAMLLVQTASRTQAHNHAHH